MLSIIKQRSTKYLYFWLVKSRARLVGNKRPNIYYFGYGANLSVDRFRSRHMNAEEVGNGRLEGYNLKFSLSNEYKGKGYAGVHPETGKTVWGVVYKLDFWALKLLDAMEWCGFGAYRREKLNVIIDETGEKVGCWCYIVNNPSHDLYPSKQYLNYIIRESEQRRFPNDYIDFLKGHDFRESFELDHTFSLLRYGKKRWLSKELAVLYRVHDRIREKICDLV